jgi:hypothetical protein
MATIFSLYPWKFDTGKWARTLREKTAGRVDEWAYLMDVKPATLSNWRHMDALGRHPYPSMANFLILCNELDLDPRDFWALDIPEVNDEQS